MTTPLSAMKILELVHANANWAEVLAVAFCGRLAANLGAKVQRIPLHGEDPLNRLIGSSDENLREFLLAGKQLCGHYISDKIDTKCLIICDHFADEMLKFRQTNLPNFIPQPNIQVIISASENQQQQSEFTLSAQSGVMNLIGSKDASPLPLGGHQPAYSAGLSAYTAMVTALFAQQNPLSTKSLSRVEVYISNTLFWLNWKNLLCASWGLKTPTRQGRLAPWPILRCADGWIAVVYRDVEWDKLKQLISDERLEEKKFQSRAGRIENRSTLHDIIEENLLKFTRLELQEKALTLRLPLGPVYTPSELPKDAQYISRDIFQHWCNNQSDYNQNDIVQKQGYMHRLPIKWNGVSVVDIKPAINFTKK